MGADTSSFEKSQAVRFCVRRSCRKTAMFSTELKGRHEENTIILISVGSSLAGEGLISKNSIKCVNAGPFSPDVLGQGYSERACYYVVTLA